MDNVLDVAQFIFKEYQNISSRALEETKLHKLLYFAQRESLAVTGEPLFDAPFEAWAHGPVCRAVRRAFSHDGVAGGDATRVSRMSTAVAAEVIYRYGDSTASVLSEITHSETSWLNARGGPAAGERCTNELSLDDMRADASRAFPYDDDEDDDLDPDLVQEVLEIARRVKSGEMETYDIADIAIGD